MSTKVLFLIAIALLIINYIVLITHSPQPITSTIKNITYSSNKVEIHLQNYNKTFVLFTNTLLEIKEKDKVTIHAKENWYKGEKQYIINKITKVHSLESHQK